MRSSLFLSASLLIAASRLAASGAGQLQGVATDKSGAPLPGVVVRLLSTGDSTVSAADGSWRLAWTTSAQRRTVTRSAGSGLLERRGGHLVMGADGFRLDGRRERFGGGSTTLPDGAVSARSAVASDDTLEMRWKGVSFLCPVAPTSSGLVGRTPLDTTGLGRFVVRATRYEPQGFRGLALDIMSLDEPSHDSLRLRLHLNGTTADIANFAVRVDIAQFYDASGFNKPAGLTMAELAAISAIHPRRVDALCTAESQCAWTFDIPIAPIHFTQGSRLALLLIFDSHASTGDTTSLRNAPPTHDPFAGSDWSFRPHHDADAPAYAGIPAALGDPLNGAVLAPLAPYIELKRGDRTLFGQSPTTEN